jgi:hypothetical protein
MNLPEQVAQSVEEHLHNHRKSVKKELVATHTGLIIHNTLPSLQKITIGNLRVPHQARRRSATTTVAQYITRQDSTRHIWLPNRTDLEASAIVPPIGESSREINPVLAWRDYTNRLRGTATSVTYGGESTEMDISKEALDLLKIIGATVLEPEESLYVAHHNLVSTEAH